MIADQTVGGLLRETAARVPDTVALVAGERTWTYAELLAQAERAAHALLARFEPGARVAVWAPNIPEWVIFEFAAGLAGTTIVTVNPALREQELAHVLGQSRADGIVLVPEYRGSPMAEILERVRGDLREVISFGDWDAFCEAPPVLLPDVDPGAPAQIQYTSGTTGRPKGAVLHHRGIVNNARLSYERIRAPRGLVQLSPMPLFHAAGCVTSALGSVACAGTLILPPYFEPGMMLELIERHRPACILGVPTMLIACLNHPRLNATDVSSVEVVITGGSLVPPALVRRVEAAFDARVSIVYAQTEASPVITQTAPDDSDEDRATTVGRPLAHTEVKIVDGELCTRGYHVMTGYFDDPEATAAAIDADGWLHTGDLATMDERGYCRISGRLKEMIIRGGENIYPREVEQVLSEHPDVADVAVIGVPDETWGEQVAAFVRPAEGRTPDPGVLFAYCRERLAPHKTPRFWTFLDEFPLTPSGKAQKHMLRERMNP